MKRIRLTYHTLHVLKWADPKLRNAIIANCNMEALNGICECALNVLHVNIALTAWRKRKLKKHKTSLRNLAENTMCLSAKRKVIGQKGGFLLPLLNAILPRLAGLVFSSRQ